MKTRLELAFSQYWLMHFYPLVGWDGEGTAPNQNVALLYDRVWKLWRIATTHEGVVE